MQESEKKNVFSRLLNVAKQFISLISSGKLLQEAGPTMANARTPFSFRRPFQFD